MLRTARGVLAARQAERGERAGDLADVPLDRVQPVGAVGDVGGADVLAGGQQVLHPPRDQRAERDLERDSSRRRCSCRRRSTGAGRCGTCRRRPSRGRSPRPCRRGRPATGPARPRCTRPGCGATRGCTAPGPARPRSPVTSPRSRRPGNPVPPSGRGASVCSQYRTDRDSSRAAARCVAGVRHVDDRALEVVDHRPVDQADVAGVGAGLEEPPGGDAPERPQVAVARVDPLVGRDQQRVVVRVGREAAFARRAACAGSATGTTAAGRPRTAAGSRARSRTAPAGRWCGRRRRGRPRSTPRRPACSSAARSPGALGSPVSSCASNPVTYSTPASGSSSPVSVASRTYGAVTVISVAGRRGARASRR